MSFNSREFINISDRRLEELSDFLERMGLHYEGGAEFTVILYDDEDEIVGTGSLCGSVLKYIAVTDELQGEGASAAIVSRLVSHAYMIGRKKLFLFTKPQKRREVLSCFFEAGQWRTGSSCRQLQPFHLWTQVSAGNRREHGRYSSCICCQ